MSHSTPRIPIEDFFRNPETSIYTISPDGKYLAFLAPYELRMNVHVRSITSGVVRRLTEETSRNIANIYWANSSTVVFMRDVDGDENYQLFAVDADGGKTRALTPFAGVQTQVFDLLKDDTNGILITLNKRVASLFDIVRIDVNTGEMTTVAENPGNIVNWVSDHNGVVRVAQTSDGVNHTLLYRDNADEEFRPLVTTNFRESVAPLAFDYDNKKFYVSSDRGRNTKAICLFDPETASEGSPLFTNDEYDVQGLLFSDKRKCITGASYYSWKHEIIITDDETRQMIDAIRAQLPDMQIYLTDSTREEDVFIVSASNDRNSARYYLYNRDQEQLTKIADSRPWLHAEELAEVKPVTYTTRDGLKIHGYLTIPKNSDGRNLPVIMYPHGGPWVRDRWVFDPSVQFFANLGYAVMQMNYRGSTGYGRKFWEASFKQWGRAMQDDISDAVAWLVSQDIADPKRVAIVGGSYGGYAVLAGLAFTPDLYCCGIDIVGVSNLFTFRQTIPEYWKPMDEMSNVMIGDPVADADLLRSVSPFFHAGNIKVPLLVFQGAKDPRVNIAESDQIVEALRAKNIDVEYIVKEDEGHGFSNQENKVEMFGTIERFLQTHL